MAGSKYFWNKALTSSRDSGILNRNRRFTDCFISITTYRVRSRDKTPLSKSFKIRFTVPIAIRTCLPTPAKIKWQKYLIILRIKLFVYIYTCVPVNWVTCSSILICFEKSFRMGTESRLNICISLLSTKVPEQWNCSVWINKNIHTIILYKLSGSQSIWTKNQQSRTRHLVKHGNKNSTHLCLSP